MEDDLHKQAILRHSAHEKNTILFFFSRVFNHSTCICFKAKYKQVIVITIIYSFCLGQFLKTPMHICLLFIVVTQEVWD